MNWVKQMVLTVGLLDATVRKQLLTKFAPSLRLHSREPYLPVDPAAFFSCCQVEDLHKAGQSPFTQLKLRKCRHSFDGDKNLENGEIKNVPVTSFVTHMDERIHLHYWFFYPTNGFQGPCFHVVESKQKL